MRILLTSASFNADYGGPALSVSRLGSALRAQGVDVALWAPDGSAATSSVVPEVARLERLSGPLSEVVAGTEPFDILHDSGVWLPHNHALAGMSAERGMCRIVSPRGMLEPWAIRYKRFKKRAAWLLYQKRDLLRAAALHATSVAEAEQFRALGLTPAVHIVPNGMDVPDTGDLEQYRPNADSTRRHTAVFLSRVHPKKGLPMLIEAWHRLRPNDWRLVIAGPSELGHADEIAALVRSHGLGDSITVSGPQYGDDKMRLLATADLFVLPTYSENFGMAVAEALAHGVPVLTTTGAPWQEIARHACGWWVAPETDAITLGLSRALATTSDELCAMGRRGRQLIASSYGWDGIATRMVSAYDAALGAHTKSRAA